MGFKRCTFKLGTSELQSDCANHIAVSTASNFALHYKKYNVVIAIFLDQERICERISPDCDHQAVDHDQKPGPAFELVQQSSHGTRPEGIRDLQVGLKLCQLYPSLFYNFHRNWSLP